MRGKLTLGACSVLASERSETDRFEVKASTGRAKDRLTVPILIALQDLDE